MFVNLLNTTQSIQTYLSSLNYINCKRRLSHENLTLTFTAHKVRYNWLVKPKEVKKTQDIIFLPPKIRL